MDREAASVAKAAKIFGIQPRHLHAAIVRGELHAAATGVSEIVLFDDIKSWLRGRSATKRPRQEIAP